MVAELQPGDEILMRKQEASRADIITVWGFGPLRCERNPLAAEDVHCKV